MQITFTILTTTQNDDDDDDAKVTISFLSSTYISSPHFLIFFADFFCAFIFNSSLVSHWVGEGG